MKTYFLLLIGMLLQFNFFAQKNIDISFDYKQEALSVVMNDLETRYDLNFSYANEPSLLTTDITAMGESVPLREGLDKIFQDQPIDYRLMSGQVVLRYKEILSENTPPSTGQIAPKIEETPTEIPERITYDPPREEVSDVDPLPSRQTGLFSLDLNWDDEDHDHSHRHFWKNCNNAGGLEFYTSEIFNYHLSFKNGGEHFYSMVNLSSDRIWPWNYKRSDPQWAFGIGVGYRTYLFRIPLRTEIIVNHINEDRFISTRLNELAQARMMIGIPIFGSEITIGPSFNFHISGILNDDTNQIGSNLLPGWEQSETNNDIGYYYWVGATIGFLF